MLDRLIDFAIDFLDMFRFWVVLEPYERGVVVTLGRWVREIGPGLHLIWPFNIDGVDTENVVPTTDNLGDQHVTTKDGKTLVISLIVMWSISDVRKMVLEVEDARGVLMDVCYGQAVRLCGQHTWQEIFTDQEGMERRLTEAMRRRSHHWGLKIHSVQIADLAVAKVIRLAGMGG